MKLGRDVLAVLERHVQLFAPRAQLMPRFHDVVHGTSIHEIFAAPFAANLLPRVAIFSAKRSQHVQQRNMVAEWRGKFVAALCRTLSVLVRRVPDVLDRKQCNNINSFGQALVMSHT